jgi:hypothetical protein
VLIEFYNKVDPLVKAGVPIEMVRNMDIVTELMRLKERAGVEPIEEASKAILVQRDALAEEYEVKL